MLGRPDILAMWFHMARPCTLHSQCPQRNRQKHRRPQPHLQSLWIHEFKCTHLLTHQLKHFRVRCLLAMAMMSTPLYDHLIADQYSLTLKNTDWLQLLCTSYHKVDMLTSNTTIICTPIIERHVVRCGSKNWHQKELCLKETQHRAQIFATIVGSILKLDWGEPMWPLHEHKSLHFDNNEY
jgi:hypothetical protein